MSTEIGEVQTLNLVAFYPKQISPKRVKTVIKYIYGYVMKNCLKKISFVTLLLLIACPITASAYIGPGLGMGALASVLGILAGLIMLLIGVVWYPIKKLILRLKSKK